MLDLSTTQAERKPSNEWQSVDSTGGEKRWPQ